MMEFLNFLSPLIFELIILKIIEFFPKKINFRNSQLLNRFGYRYVQFSAIDMPENRSVFFPKIVVITDEAQIWARTNGLGDIDD
jgi:hypothetical protein